jgi:hypothetical protein
LKLHLFGPHLHTIEGPHLCSVIWICRFTLPLTSPLHFARLPGYAQLS